MHPLPFKSNIIIKTLEKKKEVCLIRGGGTRMYVIKQNESELANITFDVTSNTTKEKFPLVFYCFAKPSTACISGTNINKPILWGFLLNIAFKTILHVEN